VDERDNAEVEEEEEEDGEEVANEAASVRGEERELISIDCPCFTVTRWLYLSLSRRQ